MLDLRRIPRLAVSLEARCRADGVEFSGLVRDLNQDGCFVATETPLDPGATVELSFRLPDDEQEQRVTGRVVRSAGRKDDHPGFALEFDLALERTPGV